MVLGGGAYGRCLAHEGGVLKNGISAHMRDPTELPQPFHHVRTQGKVCPTTLALWSWTFNSRAVSNKLTIFRKPHSISLSVQFSSVTQLCPTLCDPVNLSTPGLPLHHQLPEFTQTHVHWVSDAIHTSHPLSSPSPPAHNPSQHQSLFQWVNSSHEVAKVLEFQL